jgi:hypothetical protein
MKKGLRKGEFTHDALMLAGMVILTLIIIFWAINFGSGKIERLLEKSPKYAQQYVAGSISIASTTDGNLSTKLYVDGKFKIVLASKSTGVLTEDTPYSIDHGRLNFGDPKNPIDTSEEKLTEYVNPMRDAPFVYRDGIRINVAEFNFDPETGHKAIEISKIGNVIGVGGSLE